MRALLILYLTNQLNTTILTPTSYLAPTVRWCMYANPRWLFGG